MQKYELRNGNFNTLYLYLCLSCQLEKNLEIKEHFRQVVMYGERKGYLHQTHLNLNPDSCTVRYDFGKVLTFSEPQFPYV